MEEDAAQQPGNDRVCVELSGDSQSPGQARRAAKEVLRRWQLPSLVDRVVLVVSELVTNSVRYGGPPVSMVLSLRSRVVRVAVHDAVSMVPDLHPDAALRPDAESGRGLLIVTAIADEVGVEQVPGDGKHVIASFKA